MTSPTFKPLTGELASNSSIVMFSVFSIVLLGMVLICLLQKRFHPARSLVITPYYTPRIRLGKGGLTVADGESERAAAAAQTVNGEAKQRHRNQSILAGAGGQDLCG